MANKSKQIVWGVRREGRTLWTRNAVKGVSVSGARRKRAGRIEWRRWDPTDPQWSSATLHRRVNAWSFFTGTSRWASLDSIHDSAYV